MGRRPKTVVSAVIKIGRTRAAAPSITAWSRGSPSTRSRWILSIRTIPLFTTTPTRMMIPDPPDGVHAGLAEVERPQRAEHREGDRGQHREGQQDRLEQDPHEQENEHDREVERSLHLEHLLGLARDDALVPPQAEAARHVERLERVVAGFDELLLTRRVLDARLDVERRLAVPAKDRALAALEIDLREGGERDDALRREHLEVAQRVEAVDLLARRTRSGTAPRDLLPGSAAASLRAAPRRCSGAPCRSSRRT